MQKDQQKDQMRIKVLHVDDEPVVLESTKATLERRYENFSVDTVTSAEESLKSLKSGEYDVVVVDYKLLGMDGLELLQHLRSTGNMIPFIMLTGKGREDVAMEALNKGANHYLLKHGDVSKLFEKLAQVIKEEVEKKRTEEKLAELEKERQIVLDSVPAMIFHVDRNGNYNYVNRLFAETFGLTSDDFKGVSIKEIFPKEADNYIKSDREVIESGLPKMGVPRGIKIPTGTKWLMIDKVPVKGADGTVTGLIGFGLDFTERKRAEEALQKSERKYRFLYEESPSINLIIGIDGRIQNANKAALELFGYSRDNIVGKQALEFVIPKHRGKLAVALEKMFGGEYTSEIAVDVYAQDGTIHTLLFSTKGARLYEEAKPTSLLITGANITERRRVEEALRDKEAHLRAIFEAAKDVSFITTDLEGQEARILEYSPGAERIFGYKREEVIGKPVALLHQPKEAEKFPELFESMHRKKVGLTGEITLVRKSGEMFPAIFVLSPILDSRGNVIAALSVAMDITARKRAEEALRESEERYRTLTETVTDIIFTLDNDDRFTYLNPEFEKITGYPTSDFIGHFFTDILAPAYVASTVKLFREGFAGESVSLYEVDFMCSDGREVPVEFNVTTLRGAEGQIIGRLGVAREVSKRKRVEEELRKSEDKYRSLVESAEDSVYLVDRNCRYLFMNEKYRSRLGVPHEDCIGKGYRDYHSDETAKEFAEEVLEVFKTGKSVQREHKSYKNGNYFLRTLSPVKDSRGGITAVTVVAKDITELKHAEDERNRLIKELEAKNTELERFTYTVSHDLRSPLFAIQGFVGLMKDDLVQGKTEALESELKQVENAATKMDSLLNDTLQLSRIGRVANPPEDVSFSDIVKEALDLTAEQLKSSGIELSVAPDFPKVHVDRLRIVEVLVNLITNSRKYMGEQSHPKIEIGYRTDNGESVFFVKDNGIGIDESQHEKVFELFYKLDKSSEGTGAGLAIVKRIIEVHGGRIWIESEKGKGCTVCFTLASPPS